MGSTTVGSFALVLHAHQPFVLGYSRWPHGSDWLCEAVVECYLPLLRTLRSLTERGVSPRLTLSLSPVLCEQLASPLLQEELRVFLDARLHACAEDNTHFLHTHQDDLAALTEYWVRFYRETCDFLHSLGGDVLGAFRDLMEQGQIELVTSAATHGYLPLLSRDESIKLQLRLAVLTHETHFGQRPRGVWLPECAYRPRYHWLPPVGPNRPQHRTLRHGLEECLAECGLRFFFADSQFVSGGRGVPPYNDYFPQLANLQEASRAGWPQRTDISPQEIYRVVSHGGGGEASVFFRDPESAQQVWSRGRGYPGDPWYLDFYKQHLPGGLHLWRVSDKGNFEVKAPYVPERAQERARAHAGHFAALVSGILQRHQTRGTPGVVCAPYDAELLGHWWYEGPQWLGHLYPELTRHGIETVQCSTYLEQHPPAETVTLPEGSWGEGGDHRTWLNGNTAWTWERLYDSENEFWALVRECPHVPQSPLNRVLCQAAREILLMQASDWQFLITSWTARDYAEQRFTAHYSDFKRLVQIAQRVREHGRLEQDDWVYLASKEQQDFLFPHLEQVLFA
ncbi:MAG TPA: 1,4-alpha-glucan branching protein domain-containing protein [Candidatus Binatia bacterium]|nr:1,4-alpha-glucan branching protein domain-containing protein [Candidatus Binatia bacterium]